MSQTSRTLSTGDYSINHWALYSQALQASRAQGLIYPPSSWGKTSFTRRIAEQASPTSLYKSFFNQRPLRLGADTLGSTTVTPQLLPVRVCCTPASFFIVFCSSSSGLSPFVSVIRKLRGVTLPCALCSHQHPDTSPAWRGGMPSKQGQDCWLQENACSRSGQDATAQRPTSVFTVNSSVDYFLSKSNACQTPSRLQKPPNISNGEDGTSEFAQLFSII